MQSKGASLSVLKPIVAAINEELALHVEPLMNRQAFERLIGQGQVQQVRFIRHSITEDFADEYDRGRGETGVRWSWWGVLAGGEVCFLRIKLLLGFIPMIRELDIFEIPGLEDFEYDDVKADLKIGSRTKRVDFGRKLTNPIVDLTEEITWRGGRPTWDSLEG